MKPVQSPTSAVYQMPPDTIHERLSALIPELQNPRLLSNQGIGNEIGYYIFDYEAAASLLAQQQVPGVELPVTKPMVTMRLSQIGGKSILESAQDVDEYLGRVKLAIAAEIEQGKRVRLE